MAPNLTSCLTSARNAVKAGHGPNAIANLIDGISLIGDELDQVDSRLSAIEGERDAAEHDARTRDAQISDLQSDILKLAEAINKLARQVFGKRLIG